MTKLLEGTCETPVKTDLQWDFTGACPERSGGDGDGNRVRQVLMTFDPDTQSVTDITINSYFISASLGAGMGGHCEETDVVARKYAAGLRHAAAAHPCDVSRRDYAIAGMTVPIGLR